MPGLAWLFGLGGGARRAAVQVTNRREAALLPADRRDRVLPAAGIRLDDAAPAAGQLRAAADRARRLAADGARPAPRWWLVPLLSFWSLCHGFWLFGVAYGLLVWLGIALSPAGRPSYDARLLGVAVASGARGRPLNPIGLARLEAPFWCGATAAYITEWQRTPWLTVGPLGAVVMMALTAVLWAVTRDPRHLGRGC